MIATGGGIVTVPENRRALLRNCQVVCLRRSLDQLPDFDRPVTQKTGVEALFAQRKALYEGWADDIVDNVGDRSHRRNFKKSHFRRRKMKILIINGPNLNLLGLREPDIYGRQTYAGDLVRLIAGNLPRRAESRCECFQSNHEGRHRRQNPGGLRRSLTASSSTPPPTPTPAWPFWTR